MVDETRNVVVRSQSGGGTRGIVMFLQNANVNINYADFLALGRTTNATISDTTYNSNGTVASIGTNQQDRSPVVFLDLWGPATPQADGYQYSFVDNVVNCPMTLAADNGHGPGLEAVQRRFAACSAVGAKSL